MGPIWGALRAIGNAVGPRARTVACIAFSAYLSVAGSDGPNAWSPFARPAAVAAGLLGAAALWWRRERPVWVTLANAGAVAVSANPIPALVALFTAGTVRRDTVLAGLAAAVALGAAVPEWVDAGRVTLGELASSAGLAAATAVLGAYLGPRRDLLGSLRERAARAEAEHELRAEQARLGERARIAREMHDVLAHKVSLIALHAGALEVNPGAGAARVEEEAAVIRTTAVQALEELRGVLGVLRAGPGTGGVEGESPHAGDARLAPQPQAADIARLVASSRAAGQRVTLAGAVPGMPEATGRTAYRVVQEALTNVHKHAAGAVVTVSVTGDAHDGVTVRVVDRPSLSPPVGGGAPLPGSGAGLVGLAERMRLLGGTFAAGPAAGPEGGWHVIAWMPGWAGDSRTAGEPAATGVAVPAGGAGAAGAGPTEAAGGSGAPATGEAVVAGGAGEEGS